MKQSFLKFPQKPTRYAPEILSRRMGMRSGHAHNASYKSDGEGGEDAKAELLLQVRNAAKEEVANKGYQNADQVRSVVDTVLGNMPLDALRNYGADKTALETSIRNIADEVTKINNRASQSADAKTNVIMDAMNSKAEGETETQWQKIERAMKNRGSGFQKGQPIVELNVRAAANMTLANTTDETTFNVPVVIVESMSMGEFVPKRRGNQFIYNIADRTVVQNITQYKTWLEEGVEQGTFAIVAEGAVKPLVSDGVVRNYAAAKKVAGKYVITEEFAKFRQDAYNIIRRIINDKMLRDYAAILVVDLNAQAVGYTGTTLDATFPAPNDYDAIGAVAAQIETLNFVPDLLILHPQDKWRLALEKDTQGRYFMMIPMTGPDGVTTMMGFQVEVSTYQTPGYFTLGESKLFKIEEEPITIRLGYGIDTTSAVVSGTSVITSVVSDFDTNKMRMIIETYFLDYLPTPYIGSYVRAQFSTVKTALHT